MANNVDSSLLGMLVVNSSGGIIESSGEFSDDQKSASLSVDIMNNVKMLLRKSDGTENPLQSVALTYDGFSIVMWLGEDRNHVKLVNVQKEMYRGKNKQKKWQCGHERTIHRKYSSTRIKCIV